MVKQLDEVIFPPLIDHIGWRVWRVARRWKAEFDAEMRKLGFGFMAEARGAVIGQLRPDGAPQVALAAALGISKQAVQQLVDELEREGVVERVADPADARAKLVVLTARGADAIRTGNRVKLEIEQRYRAQLGEGRFSALNDALDRLADDGAD